MVQRGLPLVLVNVAASGGRNSAAQYDFEAARTFLDDLLVQLETHSPDVMRELQNALPEQAQREAMAARLREALPNLIALPWDPEARASTNVAKTMLRAIARRLQHGTTREPSGTAGGRPLSVWRQRCASLFERSALTEESSDSRSRAYVSLGTVEGLQVSPVPHGASAHAQSV